MFSDRKFFRKGVNNQKKADITFRITRPPEKTMCKWSDEEKDEALKFIADCENKLEMHKEAILNAY